MLCLSQLKGTERHRRDRAKNPVRYWSGYIARSIRNRADSSLTPMDLELQVLRQNQRCWYCDAELSFSASKRGGNSSSPSVDRVLPDLGYRRDNLVIACNRCNRRKSDSGLEDLLLLFRGLIRFHREAGLKHRFGKKGCECGIVQ